jgi:hypothetical protein
MKLQNYLLLSAILSFSVPMSAQTSSVAQSIKKTFYYSFENVVSEGQIDNLKNDVFALKGVSEVKSEYKSEKAMGQIIVVVIEKERTTEGDLQFDILNLKSAIIKSQLTPLELTEEDTIIAN